MIRWTHDIEGELELLNKHFRTTTFEKHPKAMMNILFDEAFIKVLGKNFAKQKISKKKRARMQEELQYALQNRYGRFMNICLHKATGKPDALKFDTNFHHAYKTEFGTLYGAQSRFLCGRMFFTFHCFERFEERCPENIYKALSTIFYEKLRYHPTAADLVMFLTSIVSMEHAKKTKFYFLNVGVGFLVLEDFNEFFVAKTFMTSEMLDPTLEWYRPSEIISIEPTDSLKRVFEHNPIKIEKPEFIQDWLLKYHDREI
jgi:hypothetical protein